MILPPEFRVYACLEDEICFRREEIKQHKALGHLIKLANKKQTLAFNAITEEIKILECP